MFSERRATKRFSIKQFVDLSSDGQDFLQVKGIDLSTGGMKCEADMPLDPMTPVFIMLGFAGESGETVIQVEGYVAHSRMESGKCVIGISFTDRSTEALSAIEAYLATIRSESASAGGY
jgi:hypothetical protein